LMLPFHIFSIPLEICLCEPDSHVFGKITKSFIQFWLFPYSFYFIFRLCFVQFDLHDKFDDIEIHSNDIEPRKIMFTVPYLIERKKCNTRRVFCDLRLLLIWGLSSSLLFLRLFIIHGERNE
jgi:hypothetical protein